MGLFDRKDDQDGAVRVPADEAVTVIPVLSERLDVHKTVVDAGGVRIRKQVRPEEVTVDEPLLRQTVQVTRVPVGREVDSILPIRFEGDVTVIPVVEERLITRRQLFLVEEVRLSRIEQIDHVPQRLVIRHEQVVVERQDMATGQWVREEAVVVPGAAGGVSNLSNDPAAALSRGDT